MSKFLSECKSRLNNQGLSSSKKSGNTLSNCTNEKTCQSNLYSSYDVLKYPLDSTHISQCIRFLSSDAKKCDSGLWEFKYAPRLLENSFFRHVYQVLKTVPVLFLSISRDETSNQEIEAVYLWQINKKTPYTGSSLSDYVCLDSRRTEQVYIETTSSLMLLAKIVPGHDERITEARILGEDQLLVKSLDSESCEIVMRVYEVDRLFYTMRVNPYRYQIIANENYSYKFTVSFEVKEMALS